MKTVQITVMSSSDLLNLIKNAINNHIDGGLQTY